ncbi:hypothetical protein ABT213_06130 [Streptomyces sp. NPDC001674]|uniref:hypothetical protein n=1 Tax=Streptomyces sp. NPDC001674 TaxID=3154394 RepID=UPI003322C5A5
MSRDPMRDFLEGNRSSAQPATRRPTPNPAPAPPPRTVRANDRCETGLSYVGTWRERGPLPWEVEDEDDVDEDLVEELDDNEDGDDFEFVPLGGRR